MVEHFLERAHHIITHTHNAHIDGGSKGTSMSDAVAGNTL